MIGGSPPWTGEGVDHKPISIENASFEVPAGLAGRIWGKDPSAWPSGEDDPADRLGWLDPPVEMAGEVDRLEAFAAEVRADGVDRVALLGMGGSGLAPEVFGAMLASSGGAHLEICDSTHPVSVLRGTETVAGEGSLFLVSSKSGGTVETMSLYRHFRSRHDDGRSFVAITDPGTSLEELAREEGFRTAFLNPPDIGGRFSALSFFGLVPAALVGAKLDDLLGSARAISEACRREGPDNPGLALGAAIGSLARAGRDKLTFLMPEGLLPFGDWVEQLIAESTGKHGRGITPVVREPLVVPERYGHDRAFVHLRTPGADDLASLAPALADLDHPVVSLEMSAAEDVGAEMFRWEFATAVACSIIGVNAFDQPDVEAAKKAARAALESPAEDTWPEDDPDSLFDGAGAGELACLLAFAPPSRDAAATLEAGRRKLVERSGIATSAGFGPRYLHSTGQLHKGGPPTVRALVILDVPTEDVPIPGSEHGFARLVSAQAFGDAEALGRAGRRVARTSWGRFETWART
jgi:transaldolase / glucose-6-phosphate isomerase